MLFNIMFGAIVHAARQKYEQEELGVQVMQKNGVFTGSGEFPDFHHERYRIRIVCRIRD
jgi:hypothetical protein